MKKTLIIAGIFTAVGFVLALIGLVLNGFTFPAVGGYETNAYKIDTAFTNISVEASVADVTFVRSEDDTCTVECGERENVHHSVSVKDGTLTVCLEDERKWYERIEPLWGAMRVTVSLPQSSYETLTVHLDTGDVTVPDAFAFRSACIETDTGDVAFHANVPLGDLSVETDTGHITASGVQTETVKLKTSTGKITLTATSCSELDVKASTGDVTVRNTVAFKKITVKTSTGDVKLDQSDAPDIFIQTDTGDVSGTLRTEKVFVTHTSTGRVRVPSTTSGGRCEIITSTGNITFDSPQDVPEIFETAPLPDDM